MSLTIKWITKDTSSLDDPFFVRMEVFVKEQGFSAEIETDEIDNICNHILIYNEHNKPIATARLIDEEDCFHIGRVAVLKECRGKNIGSILISSVKQKCKQLNPNKKIVLGSQWDKVDFYKKCGFVVSDPNFFLDEGVKHFHMECCDE